MFLTKTKDDYLSNYILSVCDGKHHFEMLMGGADFYWFCNRNCLNKPFVVNKTNEGIYEIVDRLFNSAKKYDSKYDSMFKENVFEWTSEAGVIEKANKLIITQEEKRYIINFWKNTKTMWRDCSINFCLSGSRNENISYVFLKEYQNFDKEDFGIINFLDCKLNKKIKDLPDLEKQF